MTVPAGARYQKKKWKSSSSSTSPTKTPTTFRAPTPGFETVYFDITGTSADAEIFITTKEKLANYISTQLYRGAVTASKVVEYLVRPDLVEPNRPTRAKATTTKTTTED